MKKFLDLLFGRKLKKEKFNAVVADNTFDFLPERALCDDGSSEVLANEAALRKMSFSERQEMEQLGAELIALQLARNSSN